MTNLFLTGFKVKLGMLAAEAAVGGATIVGLIAVSIVVCLAVGFASLAWEAGKKNRQGRH